MMLTVCAVAVGCCCRLDPNKPVATAVSPDGRNEIRLWANPLAYAVSRDGVEIVAKSAIGLTRDGQCLCKDAAARRPSVSHRTESGREPSPVYKKASLDLSGAFTMADFGDWGIELAARNDGVAYRFTSAKGGTVTVNGEKATVALPGEARCWYNATKHVGCEETVPEAGTFASLDFGEKAFAYLPFVAEVGGKTVAVTESDVYDYPILNFEKKDGALVSKLAGFPTRTYRAGGWDSGKPITTGGRWVKVAEHADFLVKTDGTRAFPWRVFVLADAPAKLCEADIVNALARPAAKGADFSWVKPGKVAWDWWNAFDNLGDAGCNTKTYKRFIDFAAQTGVEYVILDEGWSETLNIWKFHPNVDVPEIVRYGNEKGVGIILWMAWAQIVGEEEKVAAHFAKLGAKGFKVDFMDRGDADCERFLWTFAEACAQHKMLIDYHGAHRPTGMSRAYPNVLNYEGIHGLEQMKFFQGQDMMSNDVMSFFLRQTAGPMDYTPGAMVNYPVGRYPKKGDKGAPNMFVFPGSEGTRCRQMAMMALYEAPLQMLCDSPTNYEKNMESFTFMSKVPVVWADTLGLGGTPDTMVACARRAKDGSWYAAGMTNAEARDFTLETGFLGAGEWKAEIFRDAADADAQPMHYVHETKTVAAGAKLAFRLAKGGGFIVKFTK